MLPPGTKPHVIPFSLFTDDRGWVYGALDNFAERGIKRTYVVENLATPFVRAWHGHRQSDTYMHVICGTAKLAAFRIDDDNMEDVTIVTISDRSPSIFVVPAGYYNGAMTLEPGTKILIYSTATLEETKQDDPRLPYLWNKDIVNIWEIKQR